MNIERLHEAIDQWRADLVEADLRVAALERARDAAKADATVLGHIVHNMERLENRRRDEEVSS